MTESVLVLADSRTEEKNEVSGNILARDLIIFKNQQNPTRTPHRCGRSNDVSSAEHCGIYSLANPERYKPMPSCPESAI